MWPRRQISGDEFKYFSNDYFVPSAAPIPEEPSFLDYICLNDIGAGEEFPGLFTTLPPLSPKRWGPEPQLVQEHSEQLSEAECVVAGDDILTENLTGIDNTHSEAAEKQKKKPRKPRTTCQMIKLEDLKKLSSKSRTEAAKSLNVSLSTLKRVCRKHEIQRWPFNRNKNIPIKTVRITRGLVQAEAKAKPLPPKQTSTEIVAKQENKRIVKVRYRDDFIRFEISPASNLAHLEDEISTPNLMKSSLAPNGALSTFDKPLWILQRMATRKR